jgi:hypothetical protein
MPEFLRLPMTYDRDSEIMQHATLSNHLKFFFRLYEEIQVILKIFLKKSKN